MPIKDDDRPIIPDAEGQALMFDETLTVNIPIKTVAEKNCHEHWAKKGKRKKSQRETTRLFMRQLGPIRIPETGLLIKLIRVSPRRFKDFDNLVCSLGAVRDGVADALGIDDGDRLLKWEYENEIQTKTYAVRVEINER